MAEIEDPDFAEVDEVLNWELHAKELQKKYDAMLTENADLTKRVRELQTARAQETAIANRKEAELEGRIDKLREALQKAAEACNAIAAFTVVLVEGDD